MIEVTIVFYVYTEEQGKRRVIDVVGLFKSNKQASNFLKENVVRVCQMNDDDIQIDVKWNLIPDASVLQV